MVVPVFKYFFWEWKLVILLDEEEPSLTWNGALDETWNGLTVIDEDEDAVVVAK
jgi:hypothetical protein